MAVLISVSAHAVPAAVAGDDRAASAASGNPAAPSSELAVLGRILFFDPGLSASGKLACATCHDPKFAYGPPPGKAIAVGGPDMKQSGTRAVPSIRYLHGNPTLQ